MTNTSKKSLEEKIAKLDALIASTTHKGERDSAKLAREKLLKRLRKHLKHEKSTKQKRASEPKQKKDIDDFFFREENCIREPRDTSKASFYQKRFLCGLVERAKLSCPSSFLKKYVNNLGLEQASRIINNLIEIVGDPREKPATPRQVAFLRRNPKIELSEEIIGMLKSREANKIIGAIKDLQEITASLKSPETVKLKNFLEED